MWAKSIELSCSTAYLGSVHSSGGSPLVIPGQDTPFALGLYRCGSHTPKFSSKSAPAVQSFHMLHNSHAQLSLWKLQRSCSTISGVFYHSHFLHYPKRLDTVHMHRIRYCYYQKYKLELDLIRRACGVQLYSTRLACLRLCRKPTCLTP